MITLGLAVGFVTYIALWLAGAGWYAIANSRWASALSDTGIMPEIHPRALSRQVEEDPVGFFTSIPRITLRAVGLLFHRSDNAAVEVWRLQTQRRFFLVAAFTVAGLYLPLAGWLLDRFAQVAQRSSGGPPGYFFVAFDALLLTFFLLRMAALGIRWGNGEQLRAINTLIPVAGLTILPLVVLAHQSVLS